MTTPQTNKELVEAAKEKLIAISEHGAIGCDGCRKILGEAIEELRTALQSNPDKAEKELRP